VKIFKSKKDFSSIKSTCREIDNVNLYDKKSLTYKKPKNATS